MSYDPPTPAFPPKAYKCITDLAGLLAFLVSGYLPMAILPQWHVAPENTMQQVLHQDYSYGDSAGLTPASLLIVANRNLRQNQIGCKRNITPNNHNIYLYKYVN